MNTVRREKRVRTGLVKRVGRGVAGVNKLRRHRVQGDDTRGTAV